MEEAKRKLVGQDSVFMYFLAGAHCQITLLPLLMLWAERRKAGAGRRARRWPHAHILLPQANAYLLYRP